MLVFSAYFSLEGFSLLKKLNPKDRGTGKWPSGPFCPSDGQGTHGLDFCPAQWPYKAPASELPIVPTVCINPAESDGFCNARPLLIRKDCGFLL